MWWHIILLIIPILFYFVQEVACVTAATNGRIYYLSTIWTIYFYYLFNNEIYLIIYFYYLSIYLFNNGMGCQNVWIAPASSADTWCFVCFVCTWCYVVVVCCAFLHGLKMKEVNHWGVKVGLKLFVVGMLLLFRRNQRGRWVEVIVSVCMLILIHFCIVGYLLQIMVYHKELSTNFLSWDSGCTELIDNHRTKLIS